MWICSKKSPPAPMRPESRHISISYLSISNLRIMQSLRLVDLNNYLTILNSRLYQAGIMPLMTIVCMCQHLPLPFSPPQDFNKQCFHFNPHRCLVICNLVSPSPSGSLPLGLMVPCLS